MNRASRPDPDPSAQTIVLGATSLVGRFLTRRLVDAGIETLAISRVRQQATPGLRWVTADLMALDLGLECVAQIAFSASPIWLLPRALPALYAAGVRRLVAFSSTSLLTKDRSPIPAERDVARRLTVAEEGTRAYCEEHQIVWTILRPTLIYAEDQDRSVTRLANLIRRFGVLPLSGDGAGKRQPVHADDLAAGALAAAQSPASRNRTYNVPGGETLSYLEMTERIFEGLGRRPKIVSVHPAVWKVAMTIAAPLLPGVTSAMGARMAEDLTFDPTPAEQDFNWRPRGFRPHFHSRGPSSSG